MESIKKLHAHLIITGLSKYPHHVSKVFTSYALTPAYIAHAYQLFDQIPQPNSFFWNIMIRGFSQSNRPKEAVLLYNRMRLQCPKQDNLTFPFVLKACSEVIDIREGRRVHCHSLKTGFVFDVFVSNALIHLYSSCGELNNARLIFDEMPVRDLVTWNSLICGYGQHNYLVDVLVLFEMMNAEGVKADKVTMVKVLSACTRLGEWDLAKAMIKRIEENRIEIDAYLGNTLIDYYGRRGALGSAEKVLREMKEKNIVTMNAMITTYSKAGDLASARDVFNGIRDKDLISWSSIIAGYAQANKFSDALALFKKMQSTNIKPDEIVLVSVLSACAHLGKLNLGRWIHLYIVRNNIKADIHVGNSLIDMYSKCGCIMEAFEIFGKMKERDILTWNSIIFGLATHGFVESALKVFSDMLSEDFEPNVVTFLGVLIACTHRGLVDKGLRYFESMREVYGVEPEMKHYGCVVDLLSRSGELDRAFEFIEEMPMMPDPIIWRTLLGACKLHGNVELAETVTIKLVEVDRENSGNYVLLSNTYASVNRWNDVMKVREIMNETNAEKLPGCSLIEESNLEDDFIAF
ncbi:uncharacterized protein A4U43_C02F16470 [Asparagus officinalis]|uniref:Pentacotripeptide-repeat region of PRORP domain-containing protein n=1 Tax=Asparagus officinalis TaxID=4686 RepID=A0A5P1FLH6_ASPOF|nr:pentatricopeptide repeat-containing protein At2g29760, chloroplastic-like [Asparagus officinalis]ONK78267.1 uncharacterized protein A4U43_C02F16470 [Asparagus officinalis]